MPHQGYLQGKQADPREIASFCHKQGWRDLDLVVAVAVSLSESQGYDHAHCDNLDDDGNLLSRDCGWFQINIAADHVGTPEEAKLYTPVYNVARAWRLYGTRGFQPWHAWTAGISTDPSRRGQYIQRAVRGVANFYAEELGIEPVPLLRYSKLRVRPLALLGRAPENVPPAFDVRGSSTPSL